MVKDNETFGDYAEAVGYTAVYAGSTAPVRAVASVGSTVVGWFSAENYETDTDYLRYGLSQWSR